MSKGNADPFYEESPPKNFNATSFRLPAASSQTSPTYQVALDAVRRVERADSDSSKASYYIPDSIEDGDPLTDNEKLTRPSKIRGAAGSIPFFGITQTPDGKSSKFFQTDSPTLFAETQLEVASAPPKLRVQGTRFPVLESPSRQSRTHNKATAGTGLQQDLGVLASYAENTYKSPDITRESMFSGIDIHDYTSFPNLRSVSSSQRQSRCYTAEIAQDMIKAKNLSKVPSQPTSTRTSSESEKHKVDSAGIYKKTRRGRLYRKPAKRGATSQPSTHQGGRDTTLYAAGSVAGHRETRQSSAGSTSGSLLRTESSVCSTNNNLETHSNSQTESEPDNRTKSSIPFNDLSRNSFEGSKTGEIIDETASQSQSPSTLLTDTDEDILPEGLKNAYAMVKEHQHSLRLKRLNRFGKPFKPIDLELDLGWQKKGIRAVLQDSARTTSTPSSIWSSIFSGKQTGSSFEMTSPEFPQPVPSDKPNGVLVTPQQIRALSSNPQSESVRQVLQVTGQEYYAVQSVLEHDKLTSTGVTALNKTPLSRSLQVNPYASAQYTAIHPGDLPFTKKAAFNRGLISQDLKPHPIGLDMTFLDEDDLLTQGPSLTVTSSQVASAAAASDVGSDLPRSGFYLEKPTQTARCASSLGKSSQPILSGSSGLGSQVRFNPNPSSAYSGMLWPGPQPLCSADATQFALQVQQVPSSFAAYASQSPFSAPLAQQSFSSPYYQPPSATFSQQTDHMPSAHPAFARSTQDFRQHILPPLPAISAQQAHQIQTSGNVPSTIPAYYSPQFHTITSIATQHMAVPQGRTHPVKPPSPAQHQTPPGYIQQLHEAQQHSPQTAPDYQPQSSSSLPRDINLPDWFFPDLCTALLMKPRSERDLRESIKHSYWCTSTQLASQRLHEIWLTRSQNPIYLIFSVVGSQNIQCVAQMMSDVDLTRRPPFWSAPRLAGSVRLRWIYIKDIPLSRFQALKIGDGSMKPITQSRDGQEVYVHIRKNFLEVIERQAYETDIITRHEGEQMLRRQQAPLH